MSYPADNSGVSQYCKNNNTKACNYSSASAIARAPGARPLYRFFALSTELLVRICHYRPAAKSLLKTVACAVGFWSSRKHGKTCVVRHTNNGVLRLIIRCYDIVSVTLHATSAMHHHSRRQREYTILCKRIVHAPPQSLRPTKNIRSTTASTPGVPDTSAFASSPASGPVTATITVCRQLHKGSSGVR